MNTEYVPPLRVRIRKSEKKIQKMRSRLNAINKLTDTYRQSSKGDIITATECHVGLLINKKITDYIKQKLFNEMRNLQDLKREESPAVIGRGQRAGMKTHDVSVQIVNFRKL